MPVKVSILGVSGPGGNRLRLDADTLAQVLEQVARRGTQELPGAAHLQAFVNGQAVRDPWEQVALENGDRVLLIVPMGGG